MASYVIEWAELYRPYDDGTDELEIKMVKCEFGRDDELLQAVYYADREDLLDLEFHLNLASPASNKDAVRIARKFLADNYDLIWED